MVDQGYNLSFPTEGNQELAFDWFRPESTEPVPAVVVIHGGGWISGDRSMMSEVGIGLASRGYAAFCPSYRLAPLHPYPAAVKDMQHFVRYLRKNSSDLKILPQAIAALGNSAGGHLSAMLALTDLMEEGVSSRVNASVAICPITDLTRPSDQHLPVAWAFLEQFMGCNFMDHPETWHEASPITHVDRNAAPMLIMHGTADDIVPPSQSRRLHEAMQTAGAESRHVELPGEGHSFTYSGWTRVESQYFDFLGEVLKGERIA